MGVVVHETWPSLSTTAQPCCRRHRKDCELGPCPRGRGDPDQNRALAAAVHRGDMNGVAPDHFNDIVRLDVPPPHEGVRGIDVYRVAWPPFFEWRHKAPRSRSCPSTSTADDDVVYATPCCPAGLHVRSPSNRRMPDGSRSGCARNRIDGSSHTSWWVSRTSHSGTLHPPLPPRAVSGNEWCTGSTAPPRRTGTA